MTDPRAPIDHPGDLEVLAAGLALGLFDPEERAAALRLQLENREFARRVAAWQAQGDEWLEAIAPEACEPALDQRIHAAVLAAATPAAAPPLASAPPRTAPASKVSTSLPWRPIAIAASLTAVALTFGLGYLAQSQRGPAQLAAADGAQAGLEAKANVTQIDDAQGAPLLSAFYSPDTGALSLRVADLEQQGLGPELWVISPEGKPRSLGMLDGTNVTVSLSPELRKLLVDGATMAISLEPRDGKQRAAPTGPILGTATLQALTPDPGV